MTMAALAVGSAAAPTQSPSAPATDVIVVLNQTPDVAPAAVNAAAASAVASDHGLTAAHLYGSALVGFAATVPETRIGVLEADPRVAYVDIDREFTVIAPPWCDDNPDHPGCSDDDDGGDDSDTTQTTPWGIDRTDADLNTNTGSGIHVYVIDTGIDSDHPDLQANLGNGYAATGCKGGTCVEAWDDDHGHGTHVSGTIGAIDNDQGVIGMAPGVTLHAVKVCTKAGRCSGSDIIAGIDWVAAEVSARGAAAAANMSLGGGGSKTGTCDSTGFTAGDDGGDAEHEALCNATNDGVVFAVAAGNDGADAENTTPAAYDDTVITVSATEEGDDWPSWSNWGDNSASWTENNSAPVAIAAPGVDVLSTWNDGGYNTISGTSMASPHVAGAIALYLNSNSQNTEYSAFDNTRSGILNADESTDDFSNTSGNPHDEDFLDAENL